MTFLKARPALSLAIAGAALWIGTAALAPALYGFAMLGAVAIIVAVLWGASR
jgi:hypothetical protein